MSRLLRGLRIGVPMALAIGIFVGTTSAGASDEVSNHVATALQAYGSGLAKAAAVPNLDKRLPFTTVSPASVLDLAGNGSTDPGALGTALSNLGSAFSGLDQLQTALENRDGTTDTGVTYALGCAAGDGSSCGAPVSHTTGSTFAFTVPVHLAKSVSVPLAVDVPLSASKSVGAKGGSVTAAVTLDGTLVFTIDSSGVVATNDVALAPTTFTLSAKVSGASVSLPVDIGLASATVGGTITSASVDTPIALADPDGSGGITSDELASTAASDLGSVTPSATLSAALNLTSPLLSGTTVSLPFGLDSDGFTPKMTGSPAAAFAPFTSVSPDVMLGGVGQLAGALNSITSGAGTTLPLLHEGLANLAKLSQPILDFVSSQSVICGTKNTTPPSGPIDGVAANLAFFCSATALAAVQSKSITWTAVSGAELDPTNTPDTNDGTITGPDDTAATHKVAKFIRKGDGPIVIEATYKTASDGATHKVVQAPVTANALMGRLHDFAGFDNPSDAIAYDPATRALTFKLHRHFDVKNGSGHNVTLDIGDKLKGGTLVGSISAVTTDPAKAATLDADLTGIDLNVTLGVLLVDAPEDIDPAGSAYPSYPTSTPSLPLPRGPQDRFFLAPPASGHLLSIDDAKIVGNVHLAGSVGFVGVSLDGADDKAFSFEKKTAGAPIATADFTVPSGKAIPVRVDGTTTTIPGAITFRGLGMLDVLSSSGPVSANLNATLHGALTGKASLNTGDGPESVLASGTVTLDVDDAQAFLSDPTGHLTVDASGLKSGLQGFADLATTNPKALFDLILNGLTAALNSIDSASGAFSDPLPVVGKSPKDLFAQISSLKQQLSELQGGPGPVVSCGTGFSGSEVTGSADNLTQADGSTAPLVCVGKLLKPLAAGAVPHWSVGTASSLGTPVDGTAATVGTPTSPATAGQTLTLPPGAKPYLLSKDHPDGFRVNLTFDDPDGAHAADLPALSAPADLQGLVDSLLSKLGLPAGFLKVSRKTVKHGSDDVDSLVFSLAAGFCSAAFEGASDHPCVKGDARPPAALTHLPVNLNIDSLGGLVAADSTGAVDLNLLARATLGIAVPLTGSSSTPLVLGNSGLAFTAELGTPDDHQLGFDVKVGPLTFKAGTSVADADDNSGTTTPGTGKIKIAGGLSVKHTGGTADNAYTTDEFFGSGFDVSTADGTEQSCDKGLDGTTEVELKGVACAKFSLALGSAWAGDVGLYVTHFGEAPHLAVPQKLFDTLSAQLLSFDFILDTLKSLVDQLHTSLDGAAKNVRVPLIGNALDAGANIAEQLNKAVTALSDLKASLGTDPNASASDVADKIQQTIFDATGPSSGLKLLTDQNGGGVDKTDVYVVLFCASASGDPYTAPFPSSGQKLVGCSGSPKLNEVQKIGLRVDLGQGELAVDGSCTTCEDQTTIPFDIGLKGLPVKATGALAPKAGWRLRLDFGVDKTVGPFLGVGETATGAKIGASIELATPPQACASYDPTDSLSVPALNDISNRCLTGTLGFLGVSLRDGDKVVAGQRLDPTKSTKSIVGLQTSLNLRKGGSGSRAELSASDLLAGGVTPHLKLDGGINVNLRLRTGLNLGENLSLPTVLGVLRLSGSIGYDSATGGYGTPPSVSFDSLYLDLGQSLSSFLNGVLGDIKRVTSPFRPIVDTLQAPLPVLSQLAALVGKPPVTLISLLEAVSGADLSLVKSFLSVIQFINALPPDSGGPVLIGLGTAGGENTGGGRFDVNAGAAQSDVSPDSAGDKLVNTATASFGTNLLTKIKPSTGLPAADRAPWVPTSSGDPEPNRGKTFGVLGLTFPIFENAGNIAKVLMGQDVKIVEYRMGTLKATAGFNVTFGPFFIGPVPVSVFIGGSATISGTFAFGYDTSGLRKVLDGGSGEHLLDGLFLDDLNSAGQDIPELTLTGEVHAGAQVDLVIVKAGVEGGISLTLNLNLHDDNHDGVLHIEEIASKLSNPICLFDVSGELDFFLNFFLEFDLFFYSDTFTFNILTLKLLDFNHSCDGAPPPVLAVQSGHTLTLLMGSEANRNARHLAVDVIDEKFTVRPIDDKGSYSVTAFGLTQEFGPAGANKGQAITQVVANGEDGKDQIALADGATPEDKPEALHPTAKAVFDGGDNDDVLTGGTAGDELTGGKGNDTITGGDGGDKIHGGKGNDTLNGDAGGDEVYGDEDNDHANGGPGADTVDGGSGNDVIDAGPASAGTDGVNTLIGGVGNDVITGGPLVDTIYGDTTGDLCNANTDDNPADPSYRDTVDAGAGADKVYGGPGDDQLVGGDDGDTICGAGGRDLVEGDSATNPAATGNDDLDGGDGNDRVFGRGGNDTIKGGNGDDLLNGDAGTDDIIGGNGGDVIDGGDNADRILGDGGTIVGATVTPADDNLTGARVACNRSRDADGFLNQGSLGNSDCITGGNGNDTVYGDGDGDTISGGVGADYLDGGHGDDLMNGGDDGDTMFGRGEVDTMFGDSGNDVMQGNAGNDVMRGGIGDDEMQGNEDSDTEYGDGGQDDVVGGSSSNGKKDAGDTLYGNAGQDVIAGDNALITRTGGTFAEDPTSQARSVTLYDVDTPDATLFGKDTVQGGEDNDRVYGQSGDDDLSGGSDKDRMYGNQGTDTMHGDSGDDLMLGGSEGNGAQDAGDIMSGDAGADTVVGDNGTLTWSGALTPDDSQTAGSFGNDTMNGNDGDDVMYGELGGDTMHGDADHDRMLGDLGTVSAASGTDPDGVPVSTTKLVLPEVGGVDRMYGDAAADRMWGGYADDVMEGGPGDDYLEGNDGADTLRGFDSVVDGTPPVAGICDPTVDNDDIIGGSSSANPDSTKRDVGETLIQGNCGYDVILGDNGQLTRSAASSTTWTQDVVQKGPARTIVLDDTSRPAAELPLVSGGDTIQGNDGNDKVFGEGGDDVINGNDGDDVVVGNQDIDTIHGDAGEDDVIGGSLGGAAAPGLVGKGQLDKGDRLYGDANEDVVIGDNAQVLRPFTGLTWDLDPITGGHQRTITLWDTERTTADLLTVSGNDLGLGGTGSDRMFGEGGNDTFKGNDGDDFVQGNQGSDLLEGNDGEDDLIGGSRTAGQLDGDDTIHGGGGADVAIGDNGLIDRAPLNTNGPYDYVTYQLGQTAKRSVKLYDVDTTNLDIAGSDTVAGGQGVDVLFGQSENDYVFGGTEDDYLEGNAGTDFEFGDLNPGQVGVGNPPQLTTALPGMPGDLPVEDGATTPKSGARQLDGPAGTDGQDDIIGGSSTKDRTDAGDFQYGNGAADFMLGDNGQLSRPITSGAYSFYTDYNPTTVQRTVTRFCNSGGTTCEAAGRSGGDYQEGNAGDDYVWGQDGNDTQLGGTDNDDLYGELGDDRMFGEDGEDAMVGDRGGITDTKLANNSKQVNVNTNGPGFFVFTGLTQGQLDRRVDMTKDFGGGTLLHAGISEGGADYMSGGRGHDSMHGEFNDDVMNGDSGGDFVFGDDGGDALWGGKGSDNALTPNARSESGTPNAAVGYTFDNLVDYVFGGFGGSGSSAAGTFTGGSDIIDWRPRPGTDPASWLAITHTDDDATDVTNNQHHQGIDWVYGGFDRDVMQGDVGKNGPDDGDRLLDWEGAFNLYSRCNASYGDDGDIRSHSPAMQDLLQNMAWATGAGATRSDLNDKTRATSGAHELALVYPGDQGNNGKAYPTTPGHFDNPFCNAP